MQEAPLAMGDRPPEGEVVAALGLGSESVGDRGG